MKRATKADKEAARRLLGKEPPAEPHKDLRVMVRELIAEGARQGIKVEVDMTKIEGGDPWISDADLNPALMQQVVSLHTAAAQLGISALAPRKVEGTFIDADGERQQFEGRVLPKKVRVGNMTMTRQGGVWHPE